MIDKYALIPGPTLMMKTLRTATGLSCALLAGALLAPADIQASEPSGEGQPGWGEWQPMSSGYAARRREPAMLGQAPAARKLPGVQQKSGKQSGLKARSGAAAAGDIALRSVAGAGASQVTAQASQPLGSAWLYTTGEGLFEIPLGAFAQQSGRNAGALRDLVANGSLRVLRGDPGSDRANRPVSWHFDERTDSILIAARDFDSFHTAQDAYWLLPGGAGSAQAQPMGVADGAPTGAAQASPFRDVLVFEEEPDMMFLTWVVADEPDADYWFWDYLYGGSRDVITLPLTIPDPADSGTVELQVRLRGFTDQDIPDEHVVEAAINGQYVGAVTFDGLTAGTLTASFDQALLSADGDNTLQLRVIYDAGSNPGQFLDEIQVAYERQPVARDDSLWIHAAAGGTQSVSGFTGDDIVVIQDPAGSATLRRDVDVTPDGRGGWQAVFDADGGEAFLVANRSAARAGELARHYNSGLNSRARSADYLVIAPRDFAGTALNLAYYRYFTYGSVSVAWLEDIYQHFNAGRAEPVALANFMQAVMSRWQNTPEVVMLVGKGSLDYKDRMGYADGFLPVALTGTPYSLAVSESRLLGFEDDPPFAIGRLPIVSDAEGLAYIDKLIAHETSVPGADGPRALLVADNPDRGGDFPANNARTAARLVDELGFGSAVELAHPGDDISGALARGDTWNQDFLLYDGHGSVAQAGDARENFLLAETAMSLVNEDLPIFAALTCAVGDHSFPATRSLAGALVLNPNGGAVTSVVPSGLSLDSQAQALGEALTNGLYRNGQSVGEALRQARLDTADTVQPFVSRMYNVIGEPAVQAR